MSRAANAPKSQASDHCRFCYYLIFTFLAYHSKLLECNVVYIRIITSSPRRHWRQKAMARYNMAGRRQKLHANVLPLQF